MWWRLEPGQKERVSGILLPLIERKCTSNVVGRLLVKVISLSLSLSLSLFHSHTHTHTHTYTQFSCHFRFFYSSWWFVTWDVFPIFKFIYTTWMLLFCSPNNFILLTLLLGITSYRDKILSIERAALKSWSEYTTLNKVQHPKAGRKIPPLTKSK